MITIFPTYVYGDDPLWDHVSPFGVFWQEETPQISREVICNETLSQNYPCPI